MHTIKNTIKSLINAAGFDLHRYNPIENPLYILQKSLKRYEVDLILDVGANTGQFAKGLRKVGFQGQIVSFEPLSSAHYTLSESARWDRNWKVHRRCALGDHDGETEINIAGNSFSSSVLPMMERHSSAAPGSAYVGSERAEIYMLDSVCKDYLAKSRRAFLKIDTQGFEWQVLDGALEVLPQMQGVQCELSLVPLYEGQCLWMDVILRLEKEGFEACFVQNEFTDPRNGRTLQLNVSFFKNLDSYNCE
jgi:FkbM family methyltransferase